MIHELKILPQYFEAVISGKKPFEIREDDRGFKEGDYLALNELENGKYTGRSCMVYVDYILRDFSGITNNYIVMGIKPCRVSKYSDNFTMVSNPKGYCVPVIKES